jgi:hypothetical protein
VSRRPEDAQNDAGSSVELAPASDLVAHQRGIRIRSKSGISKPKVYTDGTVQYSLFTSIGEPQTLDQAFGNKDWMKAMDTKYNALQNNETWHLVAPTKGKNIIDCK